MNRCAKTIKVVAFSQMKQKQGQPRTRTDKQKTTETATTVSVRPTQRNSDYSPHLYQPGENAPIPLYVI